MTEATQATSRRAALRGVSVAALTAGLAVPALASGATEPTPDAELIALCAKAIRCEERVRKIDGILAKGEVA
jgi:hypothetical protein